MKKISKIAFTALFVLALAFSMTACGGSSGSGGTTSTGPTPTTTGGGTVQNVPATQQASTGTQAANMGTGSATMFNQMGLSQTVGAPKFKVGSNSINNPFLQKAALFSGKLAKAPGFKAAAAKLKARSLYVPTTTGPTACTGGGTIAINVATTATGGTITMTFANCREDGTETNGDVAVTISGTGAAATFTEKMGTASVPLVMLAFSDNTYSVMTSKLSSAITLSMSGSAASATMSSNGDMKITDYTSGGDVYTMSFNNTTFSVAETTAATVTDTITMGGGISESWTPAGATLHSFTMTFNSFVVKDVYASAGAAAYDETISGGATIVMVPADCGDGTFTFTTDTPVHYDASGIPQSGQMTISAAKGSVTTVVRVKYVGNGLVTIEQKTGSTFSVIQANVDPYGLANLCGIQTMNEPAPISSGATGTVSGSTAAVTATLSWDGPTSDMDFHLLHLTSAPTATITPSGLNSSTGVLDANTDWHLYFGTGPGGACSDVERYIGTSTNKIASLDVDKCDGLGPEHITMDAPLPVGYYILYVNPYGMHSDLLTTVTVKLQVGGQMFSAPSHNFTSSSDPDYRAFDIKVDASGVSVISPNTSFGLNTPAALRTRKF